ncbi:uncharacterized protein LOC111024954 [Momordica charantia]|uniref:RING-type E3 ubiquitin transferase n=1 Tax=Momordica charantia TaxID=3673 RepID=A0A6J1DVX6_MOMCH|nr:uncharacterized protein LOC111024954 [Momordica charantia]
MEISVFSFFFLLLFSSTSIKAEPSCSHSHSHGCTKLHFPFKLNLSCSENTTTIHFKSHESSLPLAVKSISYDQKRLDLADPHGCVHGVFLDLDLAPTPFRYFYALKDYIYVNCTVKLPPPSTPVPCLSKQGDHGYYVYVVRAAPLVAAPRRCREVKRVGIPFEYSPYLDDGSFGLSLSWGFDEKQRKTECKTGCFLKATNLQVVSICLVAAMVAIAMVMGKISHSKKQNYPKEEDDKNSYEALKNGSDDPINHQLV